MMFVQNTIKARLLALFLGAFLFSLTSVASAKSTDVAAAEKRVVNVTSKIVQLLQQNYDTYARDNQALEAMVRREALPFIDFDAMSKLTLGKHWRKANAQQRSRFSDAFRNMLVRSYAKTMLKYSGSSISAGNSKPNKRPGYVLVRTLVTPNGSSPIAANYSVRKTGGDWKAYNVEIAGINLITNFRTNFTREVSTKGLDSLIARLERLGK